jgi:hypothetical protein
LSSAQRDGFSRERSNKFKRVKCTIGPLTYAEVSVRSINSESWFLGP